MGVRPRTGKTPRVRLFVWRLGDDATGVLADNVGWMAWNLLLAVIPAVLAVVLFRRERPRTIGWWIGVGTFVLFLPNAPYLLTDLIHVRGDVAQAQLDRTVVFAVLPTYVAFVIAGFGCYVVALREVARVPAAGRTWRLGPWHRRSCCTPPVPSASCSAASRGSTAGTCSPGRGTRCARCTRW